MLPFGLYSLLMISQAGWWTQTPSATLLQTIKLNAHILIMFNFWWMARLVNGLELHPPPLSSQKNEMLLFWITLNFWWLAGLSDGIKPHPPPVSSQKKQILVFVLRWTSDDQPGWLMDSNPICHPSPANKKKCFFFGLQSTSDDQPGWSMDSNPICHPSPANKMKCFFFGLRSTSDDWLGWLMDSNPICCPSPANKKKCLFLDFVQLLMISQAGQWTQTPSATPLQPKKWNAHILIMFNFWWLAGLVNGLEPHLPPLSSKINEMLIFWLLSTSDDQPGYSMDSNPSSTSLLPKNEMVIFGLHSTSNDQLGC